MKIKIRCTNQLNVKVNKSNCNGLILKNLDYNTFFRNGKSMPFKVL